jgi:triacylglycerol esterase/lipase EstA (alpha/beta hydrolase family)
MMKRGIVAAVTFVVVGCSSANVASNATRDGGAAPSQNPTQWPTGSTPPPASHKPYPLILAHGFSGFHNIGPIDYFYGVSDALVKDGHDVHITQVDAYNDSFTRGAELLTQVQQILAQTGAEKVNLIGHSQGSLDVRYVASKLGASKIGAVVMIAGPHRGDPVADIATGALQGPAGDAVSALLNLLGATLLDPNGQPNESFKAAMGALTTAGADAFNAQIKDADGVSYFSIAGRSSGSGDNDCGSPTEAPFIAQYDLMNNTTQPLLSPLQTILNASATIPPTNDGLVTVPSAKWGTFLGCIPADHMSEVCQIAGNGDFNCVPFYRDLANWLVARGF